jgi:transposase InsO family protein
LPAELQREVDAVVTETKARSGWPIKRTLWQLGVSPASYYRWRKGAQQTHTLPPEPTRPVQVYEATDEEKQAVRAYALKHPGIRHRELAWRMVDGDVVYLSQSTVYRILKDQNLVSPWRRRTKRTREEEEKAKRPDQRWATDLMYLDVSGRKYYQLNFIDEYSRFIVHHELLTNMEGGTVSLEAQRAIEIFLQERGGEIPVEGMPEIRSDNGSCYISRDFRTVLDEHGLSHNTIKPHCPEENGIMERANRTFREALDGEELTDLYQARDVMKRIINWYNMARLHSALGYLRPIDYYRGDPDELKDTRRRKMAEGRHQRREQNLNVRQRTLLLEPEEGVANCRTEKSHCR